MGIKNRERRKAKQRTVRRRRRADREPFADLVDLLDGGILIALNAKQDGNKQVLDEVMARLADDRVAGMIDAIVTAHLDADIAELWRQGWQPVDLARVTRRRCDNRGERMMIDRIVSQLRQYASATVDESWDRQLTMLDAAVWWQGDDQFLEAWGLRHNVDRETTIRVAIDLIYLLHTLPELPRLCPPPGLARRGALRPHHPDTRMLERVRALLAKAESTTFPDEADAYTAKAQELMARHSIDYAVLAASQGAHDKPVGRRIGIDNPYEEPKALLLDITAQANRCRAIWSRHLGFSTILGYPSDLESTELLFTSLLVQATAALRNAASPRDGRTTSYRRSFLTGYAHRIGDRLAEAKDTARASAVQEHGQSLLPVLAGRDATVNALFDEMFPEITGRAGNVNHRAGWIAGQRAADHARLRYEQLELLPVV